MTSSQPVTPSAVVGQQVQSHSIAPPKANLRGVLPPTTYAAPLARDVILLMHRARGIVDPHVDAVEVRLGQQQQQGKQQGQQVVSVQNHIWQE